MTIKKGKADREKSPIENNTGLSFIKEGESGYILRITKENNIANADIRTRDGHCISYTKVKE